MEFFLPQLPTKKAVKQALRIIDCPAEPHLFPVLVKVKRILAKHVCVATHVSLVKANMV